MIYTMANGEYILRRIQVERKGLPHYIIHTCMHALRLGRQVPGRRISCHVAVQKPFTRISAPISADSHRLLVAYFDSPPTAGQRPAPTLCGIRPCVWVTHATHVENLNCGAL